MNSSNQDNPDRPDRPSISLEVWQGLNAVRMSGLTNMLDRPVVARLAADLGYPKAASWIEAHPREYAEGVFRGFDIEEQGLKPLTDR